MKAGLGEFARVCAAAVALSIAPAPGVETGSARAQSVRDAAREALEAERAADDQVALIADEISFEEDTGIVRAKGAVQIFFRGRTLTADEIVYDSREDRVAATGGLVLRTERGETLFADMADLDADLRDGVVKGARSVIAGGGKIAAVEGRRLRNRFNILEKAVFSPCEVCADQPVPLWRIRAERIVHDQVAREIHYKDARFEVLGVPIGFLPYFRHPSPEVERATGFLAPVAGNDRGFGPFLKSPYYIVISDTSDVTLTPFIAAEDGFLLETEYRKRFESGYLNLNLNLGVTNYGDDGEGFRGRIGGFGLGRWTLDDGVYGGFDFAFAADDPFLRRYDYTERDRLTSEAFVRSYDGPDLASVSVVFLQSLRDGEPQGAIPIGLPELSFRRVAPAPLIGGEAGVRIDASTLIREDGRDVARAAFGVDWTRSHITEQGLVLRGFADARADLYRIEGDPAFDSEAYRFSPRIGAEARMPFIRIEDDGASQTFEPVLQIVAAPDVRDGDIPNEDSTIVEFDEMNLFEVDRFTGIDRRETGAYATLGAVFERTDLDGLSVRASGGRVLRFAENDDFSPMSGLSGDLSDYVASASIDYRQDLSLNLRWRLDDEFSVNRSEIGGRWNYDRFSVYGYYLFVDDDPAENALVDRSEISLGGTVTLDRNWMLGGDVRRDLIADRFVTAGGVLTYEDECAALDFFVRRRFTESVSAPRGTSFGLRVRLFGAGAEGESRASGTCAYGAN
ncbi:MAG: LPS assembly protein LptD [Pseudomonadota bacterium]